MRQLGKYFTKMQCAVQKVALKTALRIFFDFSLYAIDLLRRGELHTYAFKKE
jgi:hypothetical protein